MFGASQNSRAWGVAFLQDEQLIRRLRLQIDFKLTGLANYDSLVAALQDVRLKGDASVKVYEHAAVKTKKVSIADLSPLALYALESQLSQHKKLFWHLFDMGQNLFDLAGFMEYTQSGRQYRIAPPIVETYIEPTTGKQVSVIIDGLHRILAAKQLGFDELWVVEISEVPKLLPPIALPVLWDEVKVCGQVPKWGDKRQYRFNKANDYPDLAVITDQKVTDDNYQYFLYRDFAGLGSNGIRLTPTN